MNGRGRPPTPDILTPREWEVLALLRRGLSNREIADELGISLAGAKFHVSEIISKLGVTSREEAASWDEAQSASRWGWLPAIGFRIRKLWPRSLALKIVITGALVLALGSLGAGLAVLAWSNSSGEGSSAVASVSPTPIACHNGPTCFNAPVQYATLQQAVAVASFVPLLPTNIPGAFKQKTVVASQRDFSNPYVPQVHNDWITITYRDGAGHQLLISQGFPPTISADFLRNPLFGTGPGGKTEVNGHEALWVTNAPLMNGTPARGAVLTLYIGLFDSGWGQPGSWFSGSPMTWTIASDSLDIDALLAMAQTLQFPAMLPPLHGATPEPHFK